MDIIWHMAGNTLKWQPLQLLKSKNWHQQSTEKKSKQIAHLNSVRGTGDSKQKQSAVAIQQHADPILKSIHQVATIHANQQSEKRKTIATKAKSRWADTEFKTKLHTLYQTEEQKQRRSNASLGKAAKKWVVTELSTGNTFIIKNMNQWAQERNFDAKKLRRVATGQTKQAYGYSCQKH